MDTTISLHPFFMHQLDVGPIRLTAIAHAFNYRVAILRDGVKSTARVGHSWRAAEWILEDVGIPWGHQVTVMFQIVCALVLEVPSVLQDIASLHGVSPNVWPVNHGDIHTILVGIVRAYLRTARALMFTTYHWLPRRFRLWRNCRTSLTLPVGMVRGCACYLAWASGARGLVPFVSHRPGAFGRLLLAVYVRWQTGLLVASDWLHPVAWGGGGCPLPTSSEGRGHGVLCG